MNLPSRLLPALVAGLTLAGCQRGPSEEWSATATDHPGHLSLRLELGPVGLLARGAAMTPARMVLRFTSPGAREVLDTLTLASTATVLHDYTLGAGRTWTLEATGFDGLDSVLHQGSKTFRIGPDSTTSLGLTLEARYSSFQMRFPKSDRLHRFYVGVDGVAWCDTTPTASGGSRDTVTIRRDYLGASPGGVDHRFSLKVSGDRGDKDTVLYALDTNVAVFSGKNQGHRFALRWVGLPAPKDGRLNLVVELGAVGQVDFLISYADAPEACGEWKDASTVPWNPWIPYGTLCDSRDGQVYRTVVIGAQRWMAQNLNYAGTSEEILGLCWELVPSACETYGRLYTWNEAMAGQGESDRVPSQVQGICPKGWHIPSQSEWEILIQAIDPGNRQVAEKLKSLQGWNSGYGSDQYGFRALPAGHQFLSLPSFAPLGDVANFLTTSRPGSNTINAMIIDKDLPEVRTLPISLYQGTSLRCLDDAWFPGS